MTYLIYTAVSRENIFMNVLQFDLMNNGHWELVVKMPNVSSLTATVGPSITTYLALRKLFVFYVGCVNYIFHVVSFKTAVQFVDML